MQNRELAKFIDHTALKPETTREQIIALCREAVEYGFATVCVNPCYVSLCSEQLKNTSVRVCTVIGFPLGASTTSTKVSETLDAIENGASEVDMVINICALKSGDHEYVSRDINEVVKAAGDKAVVKVILETCLLTKEEIKSVCLICKEAGAGFVKTSTGFSTHGATVEDVMIMRQTVGPDMGVKASGGIRTLETAMAMLEAGANRLGTSASIHIVKGV